MFDGTPLRNATLWISIGVLTGAGITLAVILVGGVSMADEAGTPFGVSHVNVGPDAQSPADAAPTSTPTETTSEAVTVVPAPTPSEVDLTTDDGGNSGSGGSDSGTDTDTEPADDDELDSDDSTDD